MYQAYEFSFFNYHCVFYVLLNKIFVANTTHNKDLQALQFTCWRNFRASIWWQQFCIKKNIYLIDFSFGRILKFIYKRAEKIRGGGFRLCWRPNKQTEADLSSYKIEPNGVWATQWASQVTKSWRKKQKNKHQISYSIIWCLPTWNQWINRGEFLVAESCSVSFLYIPISHRIVSCK